MNCCAILTEINRVNKPRACACTICPLPFCRMHLEDHLGDIIRKARTMGNVSAAAAAQAAGIPESGLNSLEETGKYSGQVNFAALAALTGLNAAKLEGIAKGWLPSEKDLSLWR